MRPSKYRKFSRKGPHKNCKKYDPSCTSCNKEALLDRLFLLDIVEKSCIEPHKGFLRVKLRLQFSVMPLTRDVESNPSAVNNICYTFIKLPQSKMLLARNDNRRAKTDIFSTRKESKENGQ